MQPYPITIADRSIGGSAPCRFVAEMSNNHNGNLRIAVRLLHAAKHAGADFFKVQCYTPEELVLLRGDGPAPAPWGRDGWTMHALYAKAQTPPEFFPPLFEEAARIGIPVIASVFGAGSLALMETLNCCAYKIARLDNHHAWLHQQCAATGKPVIVSADTYDSARGDVSLWCPPGYPQDAHVPDILRKGLPPGFDGFSYHGTSPLAGALAALNGAAMVEAHLHLAATPSALEANVSLTEYQFAAMVAVATHAVRVHAA